jgi:hypothetical protein
LLAGQEHGRTIPLADNCDPPVGLKLLYPDLSGRGGLAIATWCDELVME